MKKNNRVCAALCAVLPFFGNCVDAEVKSNENLVGINSENNSENVKTKDIKTEDIKTKDVKTKDIKTEDIKTKDVKRPKKSESSIKKFCEWVKNNKKKSLLLGTVVTPVGWRGLNELRLLAIYKKLDEHYSHGGCSSSVERYTYRFKNNEGEQESLVIKSIPCLSAAKQKTFENEKFACQVIPALAQENKHLAEILDYHYGLGRNYIVYKDVGPDFDWPTKMFNEKWGDGQKFEGLRDVIVQMIDIILWLCGKGYIHGDFKFDNLSVVNDNGKPFVRVFDYGCFEILRRWDDIPLFKCQLLRNELVKFSGAALLLSAWWLLGEKLPVYDLNDQDIWWAKLINDKKVEEKRTKMLEKVDNLFKELATRWGSNGLIKLLFGFYYYVLQLVVYDDDAFKSTLNNLKADLQNLKF